MPTMEGECTREAKKGNQTADREKWERGRNHQAHQLRKVTVDFGVSCRLLGRSPNPFLSSNLAPHSSCTGETLKNKRHAVLGFKMGSTNAIRLLRDGCKSFQEEPHQRRRTELGTKRMYNGKAAPGKDPQKPPDRPSTCPRGSVRASTTEPHRKRRKK